MKKDLGTICATLKSWSEKKVWLKILSILLVGETVAFNACTKSKVEEPIVPKENTVTDICGRTYPVVKIGEQYWMAENLACIEYDTQSEPYNAGLRKLSTSEDETIEPYYTNGMDQSKWKDPEYAINLTDKQIQKLGFLYNWAAAMGYKSAREAQSQTENHIGTRQGICPNGWHLPNMEEWNLLIKAISKKYDSGSIDNAGTHMKTTSYWFDGFPEYEAGDNVSGFSALPAGDSVGKLVYAIGTDAFFWSSDADGSDKACNRYLSCDGSGLFSYNFEKSYAMSVRCVRN